MNQLVAKATKKPPAILLWSCNPASISRWWKSSKAPVWRPTTPITPYKGGDISQDQDQYNPKSYDPGWSDADNKKLADDDYNHQSRPVDKLFIDDFYSAWADPYESLMVPLPVFVWTRRGSDQNDTGSSGYAYDPGTSIQDSYWITGFDGKYADQNGKRYTRQDALGNTIPAHQQDDDGDLGYAGDPGYFDRDNPDSKDLTASLYGPYQNLPVDGGSYCKTDDPSDPGAKLVASWSHISPEDTLAGLTGAVTLNATGYYVFQFEYVGDDRIAHLLTPCSDLAEILRIGQEPDLVTDLQTENSKAPTIIYDDILVSGDIENNSTVRLTLYKSIGETNQPELDEKLCTVEFTINSFRQYPNNYGLYYTKDYLKPGGYVKAGYGSGRCYAATAGHYYWNEEFLRPPSRSDPNTPGLPYHPARPGGPREEVYLENEPPKLETTADPTAEVGQPFFDIAHITLPENDENIYYVYFEAYLSDGWLYCENSNQIFSSRNQKIKVEESGSYQSPTISVATPGNVWWIAHLIDQDNREVVGGHCGARNEITRVQGPSYPNIPGYWYNYFPFTPDVGFINRQIVKIALLGLMVCLGAWQLTNRNSWLLKGRRVG
jgi:hypothetical protein